METKHLERLRVEQQNYQLVCQEKLAKWEKFKQDYLSLKSRLETLPDELKYDIMVPVCKNAFMPGRLVNTNEILVLLGENWFVERSAKQAREMIDRRLLSINKYIEEVSAEIKLYDDQMKWTENLMQEKGEFVNIEEKIEEEIEEKQPQQQSNKVARTKKLSDQEIKELRRRQQERALRTQEAVNAELKKTTEERVVVKREEDEELIESQATTSSSLMEQLAEQFKVMDVEETTSSSVVSFDKEDHGEELKSMMSEYDKGIDRENNKRMAKVLCENAAAAAKTSQSGVNNKKRVKWSDSESVTKSEEDEEYGDEEDYDDDDDDDDDYDEEDEGQEEEEATTQAKQQTSVIKIKHTSSEALDEIDRRNRLSRDRPELCSPGDIYNMFYQPKSILKQNQQSSKENIPQAVMQQQQGLVENEKKTTTSKEGPKNAENQKFEPEKAFSGEIVERRVVLSSKTERATNGGDEPPQVASKPVSRFRAAKK